MYAFPSTSFLKHITVSTVETRSPAPSTKGTFIALLNV